MNDDDKKPMFERANEEVCEEVKNGQARRCNHAKVQDELNVKTM